MVSKRKDSVKGNATNVKSSTSGPKTTGSGLPPRSSTISTKSPSAASSMHSRVANMGGTAMEDDVTFHQSMAPSVGEVTAPSVGEVTAPSVSEVTAPSVGEVTAPSAGEDSVSSAGVYTAPSASEDTVMYTAEDTAPFSASSVEDVGEEHDGDEEDHEQQQSSDSSFNIANITLDYADMEMEFEEVMEELASDPNLEKFHIEYTKLHAALQQSHNNERCLMNKYRGLQAEIAAHSSERTTALKLAAEDKQTIDALKKEVEKAWKMVELSHEREQEARETMESLQAEIARLHELAGQGEHMSSEQRAQMSELQDTRAEMTREREQLLVEVSQLRHQLEEMANQQQQAEQQKLDAEERLETANQEIALFHSDMQRETRRKERAEREMRAAKADIDTRQAEIRSLQDKLENNRVLMEKTNALLKEQKHLNEMAVKESEKAAERHQKLQMDYEQAILGMDQLATENRRYTALLKDKEEEREHLEQEMTRLTKVRDGLARRLHTAQEGTAHMEDQHESQLAEIHRLEHELQTVHRAQEDNLKTMEVLRHDRELLKKGIIKAQGVSQKQHRSIRLHETIRVQLESESKKLRYTINKQKSRINSLQRDKDRYVGDINTYTEKNQLLLHDIQLKEAEIMDHKKRFAELEQRLRNQQSLYEAVRSDRNHYSKHLIETQNEVTELNRKLKMTANHINQLKEETNTREAQLEKQQTDLNRIIKDKEQLIKEQERQRQAAAAMKSQIASMEMEHEKLSKVLNDGELERAKQRKELSQIMTERDILGTQLVRRNDELALLYEKIRIMQSTLSKGEQQYRHRINDIQLLKLEVKKLRREKSLLNRSVHNLEDMRREMYHMHRALLKERSQCRALENELQNPQNVHRWRRLEGTDPTMYEMVLKIQNLQRRLIARTQDSTKKELDIQERERLYLDLKKMMARQPGPEVAEQLLLCQATIRNKTRQMKSLVSELHMYETQIQEYRQDIEQLTQELATIKKLYHDQKRQGRRQKPLPCATLQPLSRFPVIATNNSTRGSSRHPPLGGGFKLPALPAKT